MEPSVWNEGRERVALFDSRTCDGLQPDERPVVTDRERAEQSVISPTLDVDAVFGASALSDARGLGDQIHRLVVDVLVRPRPNLRHRLARIRKDDVLDLAGRHTCPVPRIGRLTS